MTLTKVSYSSIQHYRDCKQYHNLRDRQGIRPKKKRISLTTGTAFHEFIRYLYAGIPLEGALKKVDESFKKVDLGLLTSEETAKLHVEWSRCLGMAMAYAEYYKSDFDQYRKFICEQRGEFEILPGIQYVGSVDILMQDAAGSWWIKETKTAKKGTVNQAYIDRIKIDSQTKGYMFFGKAILGEFPKGIVYDIALKTSHSKRAQESVTQFCKRIRQVHIEGGQELFHREELIIGEDSLDAWMEEMKETVSDMARDYSSNSLWPKNDGYCINKYGACEMLHICSNSDRVDPMIYEVRKVIQEIPEELVEAPDD
jgi:PD-(D/E)XK nuclease superfamily protein